MSETSKFRKTKIIEGSPSTHIHSETGLRTISMPGDVLDSIARHARIRLDMEWDNSKNNMSNMNPSLRGAIACRGVLET